MDDYEKVRKAMEETRRHLTSLQSPGFSDNETLIVWARVILLIGASAIAYFLLIVVSSWIG